MKKKSGFTLLEILIVIIIVGVLAGLAMPRFFRTVEYSRSAEALNMLGVLRQSMFRCYLVDQDFQNCEDTDFGDLDVNNPNDDTQRLFHYAWAAAPTEFTFSVLAQRNTTDGGDNSSQITIDQDGGRSGSGVFANIR